jgi:hypothetical protein
VCSRLRHGQGGEAETWGCPCPRVAIGVFWSVLSCGFLLDGGLHTEVFTVSMCTGSKGGAGPGGAFSLGCLPGLCLRLGEKVKVPLPLDWLLQHFASRVVVPGEAGGATGHSGDACGIQEGPGEAEGAWPALSFTSPVFAVSWGCGVRARDQRGTEESCTGLQGSNLPRKHVRPAWVSCCAERGS